MRSPSLETAVRRIRSLTAPLPNGLSDRDLLRRFLATRDESAFAALVARHGPAVFGVCRRILADRHAAEDAFQATFLVLARRASAIRKTASVGCWLHGVAVRVATKLKGRLARQPRPAELPEIPSNPRDDVSWRDVRRVLDEEVHRLPDRMRLPVWLCYFEGKTRDEAAEVLGWKLTTLRGRLEDGRQRLRTRLARRGIELSAALLAVETADAVALDESLLQSAVQATTGPASPVLQSLAKGVAMSGPIGKLQLSAGALVLALGLGSTILVYRGEAGETPGPGPTAKTPDSPVKAAEPPAKPRAKDDDGWGEPSGGLKLRLRLAKTKLKPGDPLVFELDLKNQGRWPLTADASAFGCAVLLDGERYTYQGPIDSKANPKELKPGGELVPFVTSSVDAVWQTRRPRKAGEPERGMESVPFRLVPGKHRVQIAYPIDLSKPQRVSNTVEIEVVTPSLDSWVQTRSLSADRIWVVSSPTRDKPIPTAELVLKGPPADRPSVSDLSSLPGDDPKQKWIVFLAVDEVRYAVPEIRRIPAWGVAYDDATAAAIRETLVPANWGPEKDGLRLALRLREPTVPAGNPVVVEIGIRNSGNDDRTIQQHRLNIYDYWPGTRFEVSAPNGSKWVLHKPIGPIDESDALKDVTLKPGETYIHAVRLDRWLANRDPPDGDSSLANLFTKPGEYAITCRYAKTPVVGEAGWQAGMVSNTVALTMTGAEPKPGKWGEPADGLRARVRMPNGPVVAGGPLEFDFDLKNVGDKVREIPAYGVLCDLDLDGVRFVYPEKYEIKGNKRALEPGEELAPFVTVVPEMWQMAQPKRGEPAGIAHALTPGKHKLVASFRLNETTRVTAPMVEFEIKAEEWGGASGGLKARVRLAKPTFKSGEPLAFELDLKNTGDKTYEDGPVPFHCLIELDGADYRYTAPLSYLTSTQKLTPGKEYIPYVKVTTDEWWMHSRAKAGGEMEAVPLKLTPGKHKVRVSYPMIGKEKVIPVSQIVEFEVER